MLRHRFLFLSPSVSPLRKCKNILFNILHVYFVCEESVCVCLLTPLYSVVPRHVLQSHRIRIENIDPHTKLSFIVSAAFILWPSKNKYEFSQLFHANGFYFIVNAQ